MENRCWVTQTRQIWTQNKEGIFLWYDSIAGFQPHALLFNMIINSKFWAAWLLFCHFTQMFLTIGKSTEPSNPKVTKFKPHNYQVAVVGPYTLNRSNIFAETIKTQLNIVKT